MKRFVSVCSI